MLIIIDKVTREIKNNMGTNSAFPCGDIPNVTASEGEEIVRLHDNSDLAKKIMDEKRRFKFKKGLKDIVITETVVEQEEKQAEKDDKIKKAELNKLGYELLGELPNLIATFYPLFKQMFDTMGIELTPAQEQLILKYVALKEEIEAPKSTKKGGKSK